MLALANPRPAATTTSGSGRGHRPRSRRSSTLPSHLLSGYANGPDAGRAPSRLMRAMTTSTRGSHRGGGSGPGCGVGASAEEDGEADGSANASFENVFLGGGGWNEGDDDDAIPLVALSGRSKAGGKMKGRMMELDDDDQQQKENGSSPIGSSSSSGRRRKRVYRYVSHGIGGAGNFRKSAMGEHLSPHFPFFVTMVLHYPCCSSSFPTARAPRVLAALSLDPISWIETTSGIAVACDVVFELNPMGGGHGVADRVGPDAGTAWLWGWIGRAQS